MESMGDFYAIALHNDQVRAALVAMNQENRVARPIWIRAARPTIAAEPQRGRAAAAYAHEGNAPAASPPTAGAVQAVSVRSSESGLESDHVFRIHDSFTINRPLHEVFSYVANMENLPAWAKGVEA